VWAGNFSDTEFCENLNREIEAGVFNTKKKALKIIPQVSEEQEIQIPYYDLHRICKKLNITAPAMNELFRKFRENNFKITRTHFSGTGIRTDAKIPDIIKMVRNY